MDQRFDWDQMINHAYVLEEQFGTTDQELDKILYLSQCGGTGAHEQVQKNNPHLWMQRNKDKTYCLNTCD